MKANRPILTIIKFAAGVRKVCLLGKRAQNGDCVSVPRELKRALEEEGFEVELTHGTFQGTRHTWLTILDVILDPTIDQFGDFKINQPGVYFGHYLWDGDTLMQHYKKDL